MRRLLRRILFSRSSALSFQRAALRSSSAMASGIGCTVSSTVDTRSSTCLTRSLRLCRSWRSRPISILTSSSIPVREVLQVVMADSSCEETSRKVGSGSEDWAAPSTAAEGSARGPEVVEEPAPSWFPPRANACSFAAAVWDLVGLILYEGVPTRSLSLWGRILGSRMRSGCEKYTVPQRSYSSMRPLSSAVRPRPRVSYKFKQNLLQKDEEGHKEEEEEEEEEDDEEEEEEEDEKEEEKEKEEEEEEEEEEEDEEEEKEEEEEEEDKEEDDEKEEEEEEEDEKEEEKEKEEEEEEEEEEEDEEKEKEEEEDEEEEEEDEEEEKEEEEEEEDKEEEEEEEEEKEEEEEEEEEGEEEDEKDRAVH